MSKSDTIKSYLIGLGFQVDTDTFHKFMNAVKDVDKKISGSASLMSSSWIKSGAVVAGAMLTIVASTAKLLDSLSKADLGYQKFAMHMFMAKDQAKQFKIVTDAMGESIEDIRWIPELQKKFADLKFDAMKMELPKQYEEEMKKIRGITHEFTRMKVESTYNLQWMGYQIMTKLANPISQIKEKFAGFNDYIVKNMPEIAEKITKVLVPILQIIIDVGRAIWLVVEQVKKLWDSFSPGQRAIILGLFAALLAYIFPVTTAIAGLIAVISEMFGLFEGKRTLIPSIVLKGIAIHVDILARSFEVLFNIIKSVGIGIGATAASLVSLFSGVAHPTTLFQELKNISVIQREAGKEIAKTIFQKPQGLGLIERLVANKPEDMFTWTDKEREEAAVNALTGKGHVPDRGLKTGTSETDEGRITYWKEKYGTLPPGKKTSMVGEVVGDQRTSAPESIGGAGGTQGTVDKRDIMRVAQNASEKTGIPADLIYQQWWGETGGFKKHSGKFNLGNIEGSASEKASGKRFRDFSSLDEFEKFYSSQIVKNWPSTKGVTNEEQFAAALKKGKPGRELGYYEEAQSYYSSMLKGAGEQIRKDQISSSNVVNMTVNISGVKGADEAVNKFKQTVQRALRLSQPPVSDYSKKATAVAGVRG